ncbi:MAG: protein kinase domain-containing protein [Planctomycetota bacterium]|jgi:tetratricopeptide (TPR) repeat protein/predicted Ser/Thr protein kinase
MKDPLPDPALRKLLDIGAEAPEHEPGIQLPPGIDLGKYRLLRELGRGGMGVVYEAEDTLLERRVALKLITESAGWDPVLRQRFAREAMAAAKLSHPGIASVYDATQDYIAMELVDGPSLRELDERSPRILVKLVAEAARALEYAHGKGLVHRDLKPSNMMVTDFQGETQRLLVLDFGLAKEISVESSLSMTGNILGTPSFMAPEQAMGRSGEVGVGSDVYALGATLYSALTGRPPFESEELVDLLAQIADRDPLPPSRLARGVDRDLDTIVLKCLEKEIGRRYSSAAALAEDLERWLRGDEILARPPSLIYRLGKSLHRRRAALKLGLLIGAVVGLMATLYFVPEANRQRAEVAAAQDAMLLSEQVQSVLADAEAYDRLGDRNLVMRRLDEGIVACRAFLAEREIAYAQYLLGSLLRARDMQERALVALDRALDLDPNLSQARLVRGLVLAQFASRKDLMEDRDPSSERTSTAEEREDWRARAAEDLAVLDQPEVLRTVKKLEVLFAKGERARMQGDLEGADRIFREVLRIEPIHYPSILSRSWIMIEVGDEEQARRLSSIALDLRRGSGPFYQAQARLYGEAQGSMGMDPINRIALAHKLSAADKAIQDGNTSTEAFVKRGQIRYEIDDVDGALSDFTAALRADPGNALAYGSTSLVHIRLAGENLRAGRYEEALAEWDLAIMDCGTALNLDPRLPGAYNNRGVARVAKSRILVGLSRHIEATAERMQAIDDYNKALELNPRFVFAYMNRAEARRRHAAVLIAGALPELAKGFLVDAAADCDRALELQPENAGMFLARALTLEELGKLAKVAGEVADATEYLRRAGADLDSAYSLEPGNTEIQSARDRWQQQSSAEHSKR